MPAGASPVCSLSLDRREVHPTGRRQRPRAAPTKGSRTPKAGSSVTAPHELLVRWPEAAESEGRRRTARPRAVPHLDCSWNRALRCLGPRRPPGLRQSLPRFPRRISARSSAAAGRRRSARSRRSLRSAPCCVGPRRRRHGLRSDEGRRLVARGSHGARDQAELAAASDAPRVPGELEAGEGEPGLVGEGVAAEGGVHPRSSRDGTSRRGAAALGELGVRGVRGVEDRPAGVRGPGRADDGCGSGLIFANRPWAPGGPLLARGPRRRQARGLETMRQGISASSSRW